RPPTEAQRLVRNVYNALADIESAIERAEDLRSATADMISERAAGIAVSHWEAALVSDMDRKRRENEGLRLWPGFEGSLEAGVGHDIPEDRLSLSQTTLLRDAFLARLRSGRQVVT